MSLLNIARIKPSRFKTLEQKPFRLVVRNPPSQSVVSVKHDRRDRFPIFSGEEISGSYFIIVRDHKSADFIADLVREDKRLRKVFKTMRNYGDHLQYSIFECQFTARDLIRCRADLALIVNHAKDQVLFVNLGPAEGRGDRVITSLGIPYTALDAPCLIV